MKRIRLATWAVMGVTGLVFVLFCLLPEKTYSETEKRYLAEAPQLTWTALLNGDVSKHVETYLSDHFPARNFFVGLNAYWNLLTGRNATGSVYYAKDGYLLRAPETQDLQTLERTISNFASFAEKNDLPTWFLAIPESGYILSDKLPENHADYPDKAALLKVQQLCGSITYVDLETAFQSVADSEQLYYKTDHHLTSAGCYEVYTAFCRAQGRRPAARENYEISYSEGFTGTNWSSSGYFLTAPDTVEVWDALDDLTVTIIEAGEENIVKDTPFFLDNLRKSDQYTVFLDGNHTLITIENHRVNNGKRLLLLEDSYGHCLAPFLAGDYEMVVLVDMRYYRNPVSALIKDYDITEMAFVYGVQSLLTDTNSAWLS